jgi:peroxiredoxin
MSMFAPRPILLALTLILVVGTIAFIELRRGAGGANGGDSEAQATTPPEQELAKAASPKRIAEEQPRQTISDAERTTRKEKEYPPAKEITDPTGFINTGGVSIKDALGQKVVLLEFWTYSCFNCQHAQPHINAMYRKYKDDGLLVIGIHTPEFGFEKDISNVREAVQEQNIQYPVVLDNHYATWNAYGQHYWPAWYLIDANGFIRYKHFGEGAYDETEQKILELLKEKEDIPN